jgi:hypothetical protein
VQEAVETQIALAEHGRRREINDRLQVQALRDRRAGADAIEIDGQRAHAETLQLRRVLCRAHQAGDVVTLLQTQRQPLADVAAAGNKHLTAIRLH